MSDARNQIYFRCSGKDQSGIKLITNGNRKSETYTLYSPYFLFFCHANIKLCHLTLRAHKEGLKSL